MKKEDILALMESWDNVEILINEISNNPIYYDFLMDVALNSNEKNSWRAAWVIDKIHETHPQLILPYKEKIIQKLKAVSNLSKKRHFLKQISLLDIPDEHFGFLADYCLNTLSSAEPPAVRVHAMQILYNISEKENDLKPELIHVIEQEIEYRSTAGITSRGAKLLKKLRKQVR